MHFRTNNQAHKMQCRLKGEGAVLAVLVLFTAGCGSSGESANSADVVELNTVTEVADVAPGWPASLKVVGNGYPTDGAPFRVIGETAATVDMLDDSATLVGCLQKSDADKLGGRELAVVDGVTLVSVPGRPPMPGDGDSQGDAKVAGTDYNATAKIPCSGYKGAAAGMCDAGVKRDAETGPYIDVTLPGGGQRTLFFEKSGKFLTINSNQADGSAAYVVKATRKGDTQIITAGPERYEVPDAFVQGD